MLSKKVIWAAALAFIGLLVVAQWAGSYPARVVILNQGGNVANVVVTAAGNRVEIGPLRSGETRTLKIESGDYVIVEYDASRHRRWQSPDKIAPAQSLILTIRDERVETQRPRPD